jgi:adenosylhomocysteine nucleosidase
MQMITQKLVGLLLVLCISHAVMAQKPLTAIVGAFNAEIQLLEDSLKNRQEHRIKGVRFLTGELRGMPVVLALTGVGKVNAAMTTTLLMTHWQPKQLLFTGIAGGVHQDLSPGDIVIAQSCVHHDFGHLQAEGITLRPTRNPATLIPNPIYIPADTMLLQLAQKVFVSCPYQAVGKNNRMPKVMTGIIATGDVFVNSKPKVDELRNKIKADAIEMEGAAVAQVCWQMQVPCLVLRSISDNANGKAHQDMPNFEKIAAYNSASLVLGILAKL